jgi:hypothetical protein
MPENIKEIAFLPFDKIVVGLVDCAVGFGAFKNNTLELLTLKYAFARKREQISKLTVNPQGTRVAVSFSNMKFAIFDTTNFSVVFRATEIIKFHCWTETHGALVTMKYFVERGLWSIQDDKPKFILPSYEDHIVREVGDVIFVMAGWILSIFENDFPVRTLTTFSDQFYIGEKMTNGFYVSPDRQFLSIYSSRQTRCIVFNLERNCVMYRFNCFFPHCTSPWTADSKYLLLGGSLVDFKTKTPDPILSRIPGVMRPSPQPMPIKSASKLS